MPTAAKKPVSFACIRREYNKTVCGREVDEKHEYLFTDAAYAVLHYKVGKHMRCCPDCVKSVEIAAEKAKLL